MTNTQQIPVSPLDVYGPVDRCYHYHDGVGPDEFFFNVPVTVPVPQLEVLYVVKTTPRGYRLKWRRDSLSNWSGRFCVRGSGASYAKPTIAAAQESYRIRLTNRIARLRSELEQAEFHLNNHVFMEPTDA